MNNLDEIKRKVAGIKWSSWIIFFIFLILLIYVPTLMDSGSLRGIKPDSQMEFTLMLMGYSSDTRQFDGRYKIDEENLKTMVADFPAGADNAEETKKAMLDMFRQQYSNMTLKEGVLLCGKDLIQEFRMRGDINQAGEFVGGAIWHEDIHDPGDASIVNVKLKLENEKLYFYFTPLGESFDKPIVFKKK
jgi:hypothetical protein